MSFHHLLAEIAVEDIRRFERELFEHVQALHSDLLERILEKKELTADIESDITSIVKKFIRVFLNKTLESTD